MLMKMMFQIKHTERSLFGRNFLKIFVISILIAIFVLVFSIFDTSYTLVTNIFSPFLKSGNYLYQAVSRVPKFFSDKEELIKNNEILLDKIENNNFNLISKQVIESENQKLRVELKIKPVGDFISASVVAKSPQIPLDSLFLNKGTLDGFDNGDLVLAGERILIGRIVKASKNRSSVALNSSVGAVSYGFVMRTNEPIEIKGIGGGNIEAKTPFDFDVEVGDKIIVGGSVDYLVAVVGVIEEDRPSGFKNILLTLPVNVSKINTVFIDRIVRE